MGAYPLAASLRRAATVGAALIAAAIATVGLLLTAMWWEHRTAVELPAPRGPFAVGRTEFAWSNPTTNDDLAVWAWYPAERTQQPVADYLPAAWREALRVRQGAFLRTFFKRDPAVVRTHSAANAPMASARPAYPVILLRPGGSALTTDFTTLAENLASRGYVVVGFDAPARSFVFVGADGRAVGRAPANNVENANGNLADPVVARLLAMWVSDATAVVNRLAQLTQASAGTFAGRLDLRRLGAVGHSFGGATALQFCHVDARCRAAIDLDGIPFGSVVTDGLAKPAMILLSDHSREMSDPDSRQVLAIIRRVVDGLTAPHLYAVIRRANHFSFGDQILLNSQIAVRLLRLVGLPALDGRRGLEISADYVSTFFDVTLNDAPVSTLDGLPQRYPEVVAQ